MTIATPAASHRPVRRRFDRCPASCLSAGAKSAAGGRAAGTGGSVGASTAPKLLQTVRVRRSRHAEWGPAHQLGRAGAVHMPMDGSGRQVVPGANLGAQAFYLLAQFGDLRVARTGVVVGAGRLLVVGSLVAAGHEVHAQGHTSAAGQGREEDSRTGHREVPFRSAPTDRSTYRRRGRPPKAPSPTCPQ